MGKRVVRKEYLEKLLAATSLDQFFEDYWEKSPLLIERDNPDHFSSLISVEKIEEFLDTGKCRFPTVQVVNKKQRIDVALYTDQDGYIVPSRLIEYFNEGATIVISQAQDKFSSLSEFCRDIQTHFCLPCQTNLYFSPAQNQGFNPHYDSHDVFILQVSGSKQFNFYKGGVKLPYSDERFSSEHHPCGDFQESVTLTAGDTLYIPRGVMHDAVAQQENSLHITLGVYATTLRDVMLELVELVSRESLAFRASAGSFTAISNDEYYESSKSTVAQGLMQLSNEICQKNALRGLRDNFSLSLLQNCHGLLSGNHLEQIHRAVSRDLNVRLDTQHILFIENTDELLRVSVPGQIIELHGDMAKALLDLLEANCLPVNNLQFDSEENREEFCARLMRAQLLSVC